MATLVELQARLEALRIARASGVRSLTHHGTTTEYKSDQEMAAAIADLVDQISGESGTPRSGVSVASFSAD